MWAVLEKSTKKEKIAVALSQHLFGFEDERVA